MSHVALAPTRWTAIPRADLDRLLADDARDRSLRGGFYLAASAQAAYYAEGTIHTAKRLRREIDVLGVRFPTVEDVASIIDRDPTLCEHFHLDVDGSRWWLRSHLRAGFEDPFADASWSFMIEGTRGWGVLDMEPGELVAMFELLPQLDGRRDIRDLVAHSGAIEPLQELFGFLEEHNALRLVEPEALDVFAVPNLVLLGHAALAVRSGNKLLLVDPAVVPDNELTEPRSRRLGSLLTRADAVVVSHNHWDHLHVQTLARIPRTTPLFVPRVERPTPANPPVASYLRALGFRDVREVEPWQSVSIGEIEVRFAAFRGEPFGVGSTFDGCTYWLQTPDMSVFGTVDAWRDELGDMTETVERVASWGRPDVMLVGSTGQSHERPYGAAGLRHLSNELEDRPDLLRYHPNVDDVLPWVKRLRPRLLVPYANFIYGGGGGVATTLDEVLSASDEQLRGHGRLAAARYPSWLADIERLATSVRSPVAIFPAHHGIWSARPRHR